MKIGQIRRRAAKMVMHQIYRSLCAERLSLRGYYPCEEVMALNERLSGTKEQLEEYRNVVSILCYFLGQLAKFAQLAGEGEHIAEPKVKYAARCVDLLIPLFLKRKEKLGYTDGLEFLENNSFLGFKVKDGIFTGDRSAVEEVIYPWLVGFPDGVNHYQFEVANYLHFLAFPDSINLYPMDIALKKKRRTKCGYLLASWWLSVQGALERFS